MRTHTFELNLNPSSYVVTIDAFVSLSLYTYHDNAHTDFLLVFFHGVQCVGIHTVVRISPAISDIYNDEHRNQIPMKCKLHTVPSPVQTT